MNRKIIIYSDDFDREILIFLREVAADMPIEWDDDAIGPIRKAVIGAFKKMGIVLEIDERVRILDRQEIGGRMAVK